MHSLFHKKGNSILKVKVTYINIKLSQIQELKTRTRKRYKLIVCTITVSINLSISHVSTSYPLAYAFRGYFLSSVPNRMSNSIAK